MPIGVIYDVILKKLRMRDPAPTGDSQTLGYTALGDEAPAIKVKVLTGVVSNVDGGIELLAHGMDDIARMISVNVLVNVGTLIPPSYTALADYEFHWFANNTNIGIQNISGKSSRLYSKPVTAYITYTE